MGDKYKTLKEWIERTLEASEIEECLLSEDYLSCIKEKVLEHAESGIQGILAALESGNLDDFLEDLGNRVAELMGIVPEEEMEKPVEEVLEEEGVGLPVEVEEEKPIEVPVEELPEVIEEIERRERLAPPAPAAPPVTTKKVTRRKRRKKPWVPFYGYRRRKSRRKKKR